MAYLILQMRRLFHVILINLLVVAAASHAPGADASQALQVHTEKTSQGAAFSYLGNAPSKPAPTLIVLALDASRSLGDTLYLRCGNQLAARGFLCVSVDLPCHGADRRNDEPEGLDGWRTRIDHGENPMAELATRLSQVLDHLVAQKWSDPQKIVACGTSRGGFAALHLAASDARVKAVAAYSPVTDLSAVREFHGMARSATTDALDLNNHAASLAKIPIWIMIGDRDERVGTDRAIQFARLLSSTASTGSLRSRMELHVCPSNGHHTPAGAEESSAEWMQKVLADRGSQSQSHD